MKIQLNVIKKQDLLSPSTRRWQLLASSSLAAVVLSFAASGGFAQTWDGGAGDGLYGSAANWNPDGVPGVADAVDITTNSTTTVTVNGAFNAATFSRNFGGLAVTAGNSLTVTGAASLTSVGAVTVDFGGAISAGSVSVSRGVVPSNFPFPVLAVAGTLTTTGVGTSLGDGATLRIVNGGAGTSGNVVGNVSLDGILGTNLDVQANATLTGNATLIRGNINVDGTVTGAIESLAGAGNANEIIVSATGTVGGLVTVRQGSGLRSEGILNGGLTLNNAHALIQGNGQVNGVVTIANPSNLILGANTAVNGNITLNSPGSVLNSQGAITGDLTINDGVVNTSGTTALTGNVVNNSQFALNNGNFVASGTFTNNAAVLLSDGRTLQFNTLSNNGLVRLVSTNAGATATLDGNVVGTAGSFINVNNGDIFGGAANRSLVINGNLSGTNTLIVDGNLSVTNGGVADTIAINGQLFDGPLTIDVKPTGVNANVLSLQTAPIVLIDATTLDANLTDTDLTLAGLPQSQGLVIYDLAVDTANTNVVLRSEINPAVGDVAAAMSSISSLIGTVINRPSGAFVSGIAFDTPNNCSTGSWARLQGGRIAADARTQNVTANTAKNTSAGITEFMGLQGGVDFGCFEDINGGWDVSGGVLLGANTGWFSQSSTGASLTRGDFDQKFIGAYVAASRGNWSGEIQVRYEDGDLMFTNPVMSLHNAEASFKSTAMSGSLTYRHSLGMGWSLLPTVGFAVSNNKVSALTFTDNTGAAVGSMKIEDTTNKTAFVGATLGKTIIDVASASASSHFVTATYYADMTGNRASTFTTAGALGPIATNTLSTDEIGDFGEVSFGTSYVKVLNGNPGSIRQVNASVRTDVRFGDDIQGAGLTAQVRLQF